MEYSKRNKLVEGGEIVCKYSIKMKWINCLDIRMAVNLTGGGDGLRTTKRLYNRIWKKKRNWIEKWLKNAEHWKKLREQRREKREQRMPLGKKLEKVHLTSAIQYQALEGNWTTCCVDGLPDCVAWVRPAPGARPQELAGSRTRCRCHKAFLGKP